MVQLTRDEYAALSTTISALEDYMKNLAARVAKLEEVAAPARPQPRLVDFMSREDSQ